MLPPSLSFLFFFFNDTATTEIYTLSLHDALPICSHLREGGRSLVVGPHQRRRRPARAHAGCGHGVPVDQPAGRRRADRKSTRLNSSHANISYAVFCLKKKTTSSSPLHVSS